MTRSCTCPYTRHKRRLIVVQKWCMPSTKTPVSPPGGVFVIFSRKMSLSAFMNAESDILREKMTKTPVPALCPSQMYRWWSWYVSTKLSVSLFDKHVSPVFAYGSVVWGLPNKYNLLFLEDLPEGEVRTLEQQSLGYYETDAATLCRSQAPGESAKKSLTKPDAYLTT